MIILHYYVFTFNFDRSWRNSNSLIYGGRNAYHQYGSILYWKEHRTAKRGVRGWCVFAVTVIFSCLGRCPSLRNFNSASGTSKSDQGFMMPRPNDGFLQIYQESNVRGAAHCGGWFTPHYRFLPPCTRGGSGVFLQ